MKSRIITIALMLINISYINAVNTTKTIKFKPEKVTVYTQGAQLFTSRAVEIAQGENSIVFEDVSPYVDASSIQANGKGNFIITDIQFSVKDAEKPKSIAKNTKLEKEIKAINDSIAELEFLMEDIENRKEVLNTEKSLIVNNRLIKGDTKKDSINILKEAMEYYRMKVNAINTELLKIKREEKKVELTSARLNQKLTELNQLLYQTGFEPAQSTRATYLITLTVSAEAAGTATINMNYFVSSAGWYPRYEIKGESNAANIAITQKAEIFQNSGIDWDNVKLKLSTSNPQKGNYKPFLNTAYVYYYNPNVYNKKKYRTDDAYKLNAPSTVSTTESTNTLMKDEEQDSKNTGDFTTVTETYVNMEYDIKIAYNLKSDNKPHSVIIQNKELPAKFAYACVPKMDKDAFLIAKVTNWEELNLISGNTRIYFDGSYIGQSSIDAGETKDTLEINFGRDQSWAIERKLLKDKSKEKVIGNEKTKELTYEITVRNTKEFATEINVEDQIPVSNTKEIEVKVLDISKAKYDDQSGLLSWNLKLKPKEARKILISYQVKYPSDKTIYNF